MKVLTDLLQAAHNVAVALHHPFSHSTIVEEKRCVRCKFNAELQRLIDKGKRIL